MANLKADQKLIKGQSLKSDNSKYSLTLQEDGNLVLTEGSNPIWASKTDGKNATELRVQSDGNIVLYTHDNKAVWATDTKGKSNIELRVQDDRNVVAYSDGNAVWATNTYDENAGKGESKPAAAAAPEQQKYTVASGDTLFDIAQRFLGDGNRYPEIAKANNIANPDVINAGAVLVIPHK